MPDTAIRPRSPWLVVAALACAGIVFGSTATFAQDEDEQDDDLSFEQKIITNFFQGLTGEAGDIKYRERSPLVIPPTRDLPPPDQTTLANNPAWPKDPDKAQRKKASNNSRPKTITQLEDPGRPLRPDELRNGRAARSGSGARSDGPTSVSEPDSGRPLRPSELGGGTDIWGSLFGYKEEQAKFEGEPPRTSLVQPPSGYLTPSPAQPYGVNAKKNTSTLDMPQVKDTQTAPR